MSAPAGMRCACTSHAAAVKLAKCSAAPCNLLHMRPPLRRLRAERREDAAAEAQIRALAQQHMAAASAASGLPPSTGPGTPPRGPDGVPPSQAQAAPPPPPSAAYDFQAVAAPVEERSPRSVSGGASRGPRHSPGSTVQPSKVVYRSPIYRSASPSRKVGSDGVRISNFSRAPRFKTDKGWVPGPGHYPAHTTFSPPTVRAHVDRSGELGHTWEEYQANTRRGAGMTAVQMDDTRSRAAYQDQTLALQATGEPARSPKGSPTERKLRAEVSGLQQNLQTARSQSAIARHQLYAEVETLQGKLERKTKAHRALGQKVRGWRDHFARLQAATSRLQTALDASIPSIPGDDPMYPLLREINSRAREVSEQVANLGPFVYSTADAVDRSSGAGGARPRVAESEEAQGPSPDEAQRQCVARCCAVERTPPPLRPRSMCAHIRPHLQEGSRGSPSQARHSQGGRGRLCQSRPPHGQGRSS